MSAHLMRSRTWELRWLTIFTAKEITSRRKQTANGKDSRQKEKPHGKRKNLTAKRKDSRQKKKPHGKSKRLMAKEITSRQKK